MPEFKITIEEVKPKGSGFGLLLYWLFIGWWLLPLIWMAKAYFWCLQNYPKSTIAATAVLVVIGLIQQCIHRQKVAEERQSLVAPGSYLPQAQQSLIQALDKLETEAEGGSAGEDLIKKKTQDLIRANGPFYNWIGELDSVSKTVGSNLSFKIRIKGTDLTLMNFQGIGTDQDPYIVRQNTPVYESLAKIPKGADVQFSGALMTVQTPYSQTTETVFMLTEIKPFQPPQKKPD